MVIIKRKQCTYYIKDEAILLEYNSQYTSFNIYNLQSRKKFKDCKLELLLSKSNEFDNINDAIALTKKHGLTGMVGFQPTLTEFDTYLVQ